MSLVGLDIVIRATFLGCLLAIQTFSALAFDLDIISLRSTLSRPDTSQSLTYRNPDDPSKKVVFNLTPTNNERLGFFLDINGIEIGYDVDVSKDDIETDTKNFLIAYRKWKYSRIAFNYQVLEGLSTEAENLGGPGRANRFLSNTKSTKVEIFGQHSLYTFGDGEPLFEHFFLNRPVLSDGFDWSLSIAGGWSLKYLSLESSNSILFDTDFFAQPIGQITRLESFSANANIGPFLSVKFPNNFHFFTEYRVGSGHIENLNRPVEGLKESGEDKATAIGAGFSWTSSSKKTVILLRAWEQKGRHIDTSFGDLSVVRYF